MTVGTQHACVEARDARTCYELREYGYSPVMRSECDHSEGAWMDVDPDGSCECDCHTDDDPAPWEEDF